MLPQLAANGILFIIIFIYVYGGGVMCVPVCCAHVQRPKRSLSVFCQVCLFRQGRGLSLNLRPVFSELYWKLPSPEDLSISASLEAGVTSLVGKPVCYLGLESESWPHGFREVLLAIEPPSPLSRFHLWIADC